MIAVRDLVKRHDDLEVLKGVCVDIRKGEVACLIGPSGSGKSTLLRCLNGLETFQGGTVTLDESIRIDASMPLADRERAGIGIRKRVGMVFQQFHLFPHMTVLGNVIEAPIHVLGISRGEAEDRARKLLDRVGLVDKLNHRPRQLSGGQQQRVAIARTLAMRPEAILLDEPTSALDPRMTGEVLAVIEDLAKEGQTMVLVTHAMRFARQVATTVHVLSKGNIVESGPPAQIFDAPCQPDTRDLLAQAEAA